MLQLFPANCPLEIVAIEKLGPMSKTSNKNQFGPVMMDRFSKLTRIVPTSKTTALHIKSLFMDHCVIQNGIPEYSLTDNADQISY